MEHLKLKIKMISFRGKNGKRSYATDFRCSVKSADKIRGDVVLGRIGRRAKVTQLEHCFLFIYLV